MGAARLAIGDARLRHEAARLTVGDARVQLKAARVSILHNTKKHTMIFRKNIIVCLVIKSDV